jgi:copper(I)-binding protein
MRAWFAAALLAATPALAQPAGIEVQQPWARATPAGARSGAVYLTLLDHGAPDQLTGASTPAAGMAMLHESREENGVARMRMLGAVPLPPGRPVTFKPGGLHVMLTELAQPLRPGTSFALTLHFARAPEVTVEVPVLGLGAAGPPPMPAPAEAVPGVKTSP